MNQIDQQLAALRESIFIEAREQVRAELIENLGGASAAPRALPPAPKAKTVVKPVKRSVPGPKRSADEIAMTATAVSRFLQEHPGSGAETIKAGLSLDLATIELPIKKLLASKQIKKRGQKRATKYYPVG